MAAYRGQQWPLIASRSNIALDIRALSRPILSTRFLFLRLSRAAAEKSRTRPTRAALEGQAACVLKPSWLAPQLIERSRQTRDP